ncbi:MAG: TerC family protein [Proteobacteria bacterium]|nr:TerC family protein [Pseudomonadota bacterium]
MFDIFLTGDAWLSLLTLTLLEIVLGVDNIIFISILSAKVPAHQRDKARNIGLLGALVSRLMLLSVMSWLATLTTPIAKIFTVEFSGKSIILLVGGLFLIYKATKEIHSKLEGADEISAQVKGSSTLKAVVTQIILIDIVFSLDSVITAIGMSQSLIIMFLANIIALIVMLVAAKSIAQFVEDHPTIKVLALSFLMMIGLVLVGEGLSFHIPKGYVYFAMAFSVATEMLNIRASKKASPLKLKNVPDPKKVK